MKANHVAGRYQMRAAMMECCDAKNNLVRVGGFAPSQWALGRLPRGVGRVLDEEEQGHLGVLHAQADPATEFGMRAAFRASSRTAAADARLA